MAPKRKKQSKQPPQPPPRPKDLVDDDQPVAVDWTKEGVILSDIRDQGQDSSFCWAHAVAGVIEAVYNKQAKEGEVTKPPKAASVQHLINCVKPDSKKKTDSGILTLKKVYKFIERNKLARDEEMPYRGGKKFKCDSHQMNWHQAIEIIGYKETTCETEIIDEKKILKLLAKHPVPVTLECSKELIKCGFENEIYRGPKEISVEPLQDHAMVLIGYKTTETGINIFLARNSWGKGWGDSGIGKIIRQSSSKSTKSLFKTFSYPEVFLG